MKKISVILLIAILFVSLPFARISAFASGECGDPVSSDSFGGNESVFRGPDEDGFWHSGYHSYDEMTPEEIKAMFDAAPAAASQPRFEIWPETQNEPFVVGQLTQENLERTRDYANVLRRLAGLNALELNDEANMYAQYGAWLLCHNQVLTHNPENDPSIPQDFYENGYYGAINSNIGKTNTMDGFITRQLDAYMDEHQSNNLSGVGHRQHFLNPRLVDYGFGSAGLFHTMFVGHRSASAQIDDYDFIAWPASGSFPADTSAFNRLSPWSVSFPKSVIRRPASSDQLTVTVEHNGVTVDTLTYGNDPDYPASVNVPSRYITFDYIYSNNYCIIFRPDLTGTAKLEGEYIVTITNLFISGSSEPLTARYKVDFFDLASVVSAPAEPDPEPVLPGDVNGDGSVTVMDALLVMRFSMALTALDSDALARADVDGNGSVNVLDAVFILRTVLGANEPSDG